ncbi:putative aspartokinase [Glarea lozoyensis 74030]|uniref:aspartate kinase n=1 Tax=Glarea lozoyensis (strain ATCC 74030 / MF5533) TaxID=1104152 RepID=H0EIG2_GLAL7|nr:putative aspartokinase [Glarea lozoyensis 74030]
MSAHTAANGLQRHRQSLKETSSERRKNNSNAGWVVQKFGGTSVGKFAVNIAEDIVRASLSHNKIAVVCSARSTGKKVEGTTSRLLEIYGVLESVNSIKDPETVHYESLVNEYERLVHVIADDHVTAADSHIQDETIRAKLIREVRGECQEIIDYRHAAERWHLEIDSRSKDRIISFGEKLSCRFIAALLQDRGVESEYVDLGYTDLCAALVAVGINADELQVWKEVDGIFTADPSKVPTARLLATITPSEAAELTFYGSEVIHHLTMDQVIHATPPIRIRIKNVKNPRGEGTIVLPDPKLSPIDLISTSEVHVSMAIHSANISAEELRKTTAELELCGEVSVLHDMAILSLVGAEMKNMIGIAGRMFSTLGEHNVNIEMISQVSPL